MPEIIEFTDETLFPFGKYKDVKMQEVPAAYLIWIYNNYDITQPLTDYIADNMDVLYSELKESKTWKY